MPFYTPLWFLIIFIIWINETVAPLKWRQFDSYILLNNQLCGGHKKTQTFQEE